MRIDYRDELLIASAILHFLDYFITTILSTRFGPEGEKNTILRYLIRRFGVFSIWILWIAVWTFFFTVAQPGLNILIFLCVFFGFHVINNIYWLFVLNSKQKV